jgi:transcriptional regulator with XRE-family HTH domain
MRPSAEPATQRRLLSRTLHRARTAAGYTQRQAGAALGWSEAKVLRTETGKVGLSPTDVRALLDLYSVHDPQTRSRIETMARLSRRQPWVAYRHALNDLERRYLSWEGSASRIRQYEPHLIPELLRTEEYAWAVTQSLAPPGTPSSVLRLRLDACMARQTLLDHYPPEMSFVIDESALRRPVGGNTARNIMAQQANRLHELADRNTITIHIVALNAGPYPGLGNSFVVLDFADDDTSRVYLAGRTIPVLTAAKDVATYDHLYANLTSTATPAHLTHKILDQALLQPIDPGPEGIPR